jgi:NAD(P)H-quinone oxidoreductase subunit 3
MTEAWLAVLGFMGLCVVVPVSMVVGARFLRVRARVGSPLKTRTYECGEEPLGPTWIQFHPRYYVVAMFFVLFDLEAAFLLPWAAEAGRLGTVALVEAMLFVGVLLLGWVYAVRKGALQWQ